MFENLDSGESLNGAPVSGWVLSLSASFVLSMVPFASVHPGPRLWVGLACAGLGCAAVWRGQGLGALAPAARWVSWLVVLALLLSATALVPLSPGGRALLQPGIAGPVEGVLSFVGQHWHPLALVPRRALEGLGFASGVSLVGLGSAALVRSERQGRVLGRGLLAGGVLLVCIALAHRLGGAASIWWTSGVPAVAKDPFFAPFVSGNHGGAACATLLPLALVLVVIEGRTWWRGFALSSLLVLLTGLALAGSRGALLGAVVALVVVALLHGARWPRILVALALLACVGLAAWLGPLELMVLASSQVSPDGFEGDVLLGRDGIWLDTLKLVRGAPWLGVGLGAYVDASALVKSMPEFTRVNHAHQDYLQALAEHGVAGGLLWVSVAVAPLLLGVRACLVSPRGLPRSLLAGFVGACCALLAVALVTFPAHIGALAVLMALLGGSCVSWSAGLLRPAAGSGGALRLLGTALLAPGLLAAACIFISDGRPSGIWAPAGVAIDLGDQARESAALDGGPGALAEAEAHYRAALSNRPVDAETLYKLAGLRMAQGDRSGSLRALRLSTQVEPGLVWSWLHLARLQRRLGLEAEAREAYRRMLALDLPSGVRGEPYVEELLEGQEDPAALLEVVLPDRGDRLREAAAVAAQQGEHSLCESLYRRALALEPEVSAAYASWLLRRFRYDEALALVEGKDQGGFPLIVAGRSLLALGRYEEARARFQAASRWSGADDPAVSTGLVLAAAGLQEEGAVAEMERLLAERPLAHGVRRALVDALLAEGRDAEASIHLEELVFAGLATPRDLRFIRQSRDPAFPAPHQ